MSSSLQPLSSLIERLAAHVPNARAGLPLEVFYLVSRLTPMVNVDLLVQDEKERTLLVWRDDEFYRGWHLPGGIIRFKERAEDRIRAVAAPELGAAVTADKDPIAIHEKMNHERDVRRHFISLLYRCRLTSPPAEERRCKDLDAPAHGQWAWHSGSPEGLLHANESYQRFFSVQG